MVYLTGKLLYVCLIERRAGRICSYRAVRWRSWQLTEEQIRPLITGAQYWGDKLTRRAIVLLRERPRRRKGQLRPLRGIHFFKERLVQTNGQNALPA